VISAIAVKGVRRTGRVGERHIGVRSEQIDGVPCQAGRLVLRSPVEDMQPYVVIGAPTRQLGRRVDDRDRAAVQCVDPLAIDVALLPEQLGILQI